MKIAEFAGRLEWRSVRYHLASLLRLLGAIFCVPTVAALLLGELRFAASFSGLAVATWLVGTVGRRGREPALRVREAMVLTALGYLTYASIGAIPFLFVAAPLDSLFESLSGFTTTGLSVLGVQLPRSLLFFRAYTQWVGGAGIVVLSLVFLSHASTPALAPRWPQPAEENLVGSIVTTARIILAVYLVLTGAALLSFLMAGMPAFDALLHALTSVSTGGFSPGPASLDSYGTGAVAVAIPMMMAGATSFTLFHALRKRGLGSIVRNEQLLTLGVLVLLGGGLLRAMGPGGPGALLAGFFHAASAATTTGYRVTDPAAWTDGQRLVMVSLMLVGGSTGSTAGGIKIFRLLVLIQLVRWLVARAILPREARIAVKIRGEGVEEDELRRIAAFVFLYLGVVAFSALVVAGTGVPVPDAVFESTSALGTVGLSVGVTSPELSAVAKLVLCLDMWAGRLEILPVLVLLHRSTWWSARVRAAEA